MSYLFLSCTEIFEGKIAYRKTVLGGCSRTSGCNKLGFSYITACIPCSYSIFNEDSIDALELAKNAYAKIADEKLNTNESLLYEQYMQEVKAVEQLLEKLRKKYIEVKMSKALVNLNEALNRLIANAPIRVPKGSKINNDTVALEAGLKRGAVKRSRPELAELLDNIREAEAKRLGKEYSKKNSKIVMQNEALKLKQQLNELQYKYDVQLSQINSLIFENHRLKRENQFLSEENNNKIIGFKINKN
ncbi:hypothetical protein LZ086_16725 [Acinetobacter johnsonii]|nr:hypothetical protein LZ086_16725 [Acinetobacter johnsonii]